MSNSFSKKSCEFGTLQKKRQNRNFCPTCAYKRENLAHYLKFEHSFNSSKMYNSSIQSSKQEELTQNQPKEEKFNPLKEKKNSLKSSINAKKKKNDRASPKRQDLNPVLKKKRKPSHCWKYMSDRSIDRFLHKIVESSTYSSKRYWKLESVMENDLKIWVWENYNNRSLMWIN